MKSRIGCARVALCVSNEGYPASLELATAFTGLTSTRTLPRKDSCAQGRQRRRKDLGVSSASASPAERRIRADGLLVIVQSGKQKVWDRYPTTGPTSAKEAYISSVFRASRRYAETFGERWIILSAKYGFIEPEFMIPGNYNVSFYDSNAVSISELRSQVQAKGLTGFPQVAIVGSNEYWSRACAAFTGTSANLQHVNAGVGFPPSLITLLRELLEKGAPFPKKT